MHVLYQNAIDVFNSHQDGNNTSQCQEYADYVKWPNIHVEELADNPWVAVSRHLRSDRIYDIIRTKQVIRKLYHKLMRVDEIRCRDGVTRQCDRTAGDYCIGYCHSSQC